MTMWCPGTGGTMNPQVHMRAYPHTRLRDKTKSGGLNFRTRMRVSSGTCTPAVNGSRQALQRETRKACSTFLLIEPKPPKPMPSKQTPSLPLPTNGHSNKKVVVNGLKNIPKVPKNVAKVPPKPKTPAKLSIMQMEFFGKCYFEVTQKQTPAGNLEQLRMVLMSDQYNHKAEFAKIQKHFDCALKLSIESLKARAVAMEGKIATDELMKHDLLNIEMACTKLPPEHRSLIFAYLADYFPFPKCFLLVYARFIRVTSTQRKLKALLDMLQIIVNKEMPEQFQRYEWEFSMAKLLQWQQQADIDILEPGTICEQTIDSNLLPQPEFQWTQSIEELLWNVLETKMSIFPAEKKGGPSDSERLVMFVNEKVINIWPEGWMDADTILNEARRRL